MSSPFPGMNLCLENQTTWLGFHSRLIVVLANLLSPKVRPKYRVIVEKAVYKRNQSEPILLIGVPDISVYESGQSNSDSEESLREGTVLPIARSVGRGAEYLSARNQPSVLPSAENWINSSWKCISGKSAYL